MRAEDEGGAVAPWRRHIPTDAEIELKVALSRAEPYRQARAPHTTNMKMVRANDRRMSRLKKGGWDLAEVENLCYEVTPTQAPRPAPGISKEAGPG